VYLLRYNNDKAETNMLNLIDSMSPTDYARKRLEIEKLEIGSYDKLADKYKVNIRYVWEFIKFGIIPPLRICETLGIPVDPPSPLSYTRTRRERLNAIAISWGYESWCNFESAVIKSNDNKTPSQ
jgi:hypothetical protein